MNTPPKHPTQLLSLAFNQEWIEVVGTAGAKPEIFTSSEDLGSMCETYNDMFV